jgi:hypothetical protein
MPYAYGDQTGSSLGRPQCWGRDFDERSQECRGCQFQTTCKEAILRANVSSRAFSSPTAPMPAPMPFGMAPQPPQVRYVNPVPGPQAAVPVPVHAQPQSTGPAWKSWTSPYQPAVQAPAAPVTPPAIPTADDRYGWVSDPLFYQLLTAPPMYRPQLPGETFTERLVKNIGLSAVEAGLSQLLLAVRQLVFPPKP